jgi:AcrR family transcriptional regulator
MAMPFLGRFHSSNKVQFCNNAEVHSSVKPVTSPHSAGLYALDVVTESPSLRHRKKVETRARIVETAWNLFETNGYSETTLTQIAEAADVSPRSLFHYFPTKESLIHPGLDEYLHRLAEGFARRPAEEPVLTSLFFAADEIAETEAADIDQQHQSLRLMEQAGPKASVYLEERIAHAIRQMVNARHEGEPDADVRARLAASVTGAILAIAMEKWLAEGATGDLNNETSRCSDLLREMVGNEVANSPQIVSG